MENNRKKIDRRLSLGDDFMKTKTDDILFGLLQCLATYYPKDNRLYLKKATFNENKQLILSICGYTAKTLSRHIERLKEANLIEETYLETSSGTEQQLCFVFPFDYLENYQLIDLKMLEFIIHTRSKNAVRIYIYLLNKFLWKQKTNESYIFTNRELLEAIGISKENSLASKMITNILQSLEAENIIKYEEFYEQITQSSGQIIKTPKKRLLFVRQKI